MTVLTFLHINEFYMGLMNRLNLINHFIVKITEKKTLHLLYYN